MCWKKEANEGEKEVRSEGVSESTGAQREEVRKGKGEGKEDKQV